MHKPVLSPEQPLGEPRPAFAVQYTSSLSATLAMARSGAVLGVIGYGAERPDELPVLVPFISAPLSPADGTPKFEIWTADSACRPLSVGPVSGSCSDDLAFGAIRLDEKAGALEDRVEQAYLRIFDFMDAAGFAAPIRFWNYLTGILQEDNGLERYRRFNIGRHKAFAARLRQAHPPAASGVGGLCGSSVIYFLAARNPATPIENPRQVSAYQYPKIYGPSSPSFSRASSFLQHHSEALFISGTASIVGHETRHRGDLPGQIAETIANLHALIRASAQTAEITPPAPDAGHWALKLYLQHPDFRVPVDRAVDAMFGTDSQRIYLHGEICRPGLLLEIEAFHIAVDRGAGVMLRPRV